VGIEAQILPGIEGGIDQFLMALTNGLRNSDTDRYRLIGQPGAEAYFREWAGDRLDIVERPAPPVSLAERAKRALGPIRRPAGRALRSAFGATPQAAAGTSPALRESDGFFERLGLGVLHIPYVGHYEQTGVPTVLTLHDLQHRHFPQFFSQEQLAWRERLYPAAIAHASVVVTDCAWGRDDIIRQYGVDPARVKVVMLASPIRAYPSPTPIVCTDVRRRLALRSTFALYPALTYEHKNHVRLLEAVAMLRDEFGLRVQLVCPGYRTLHWPVVRKRLDDLRLSDQVIFPGFVNATTLRALYAMARLVVFPSLFEGAGLPVLEALSEGTPLVCSDIPGVREYAGTAARFFDPASVEAIAEAVRQTWCDADARLDLAERGALRAQMFSPEQMAAEYADLYREAVEGRRHVALRPAASFG
jgi:glycosyltransferase involved in cell wall biosynthesis